MTNNLFIVETNKQTKNKNIFINLLILNLLIFLLIIYLLLYSSEIITKRSYLDLILLDNARQTCLRILGQFLFFILLITMYLLLSFSKKSKKIIAERPYVKNLI
ncbi:MAG: hypothetical protein HQK51_20625, partial [Oligoflexia bacterium]|nr:hypothetical protein [Oligoflexia bacterium]